MAINRMRCTWDGAGVEGQGLSTFYFSGTMTGKPAAAVTFFTALAALIPASTGVTVPSSGDVLDESTGELTGGWTASGGAQVSMTGTGNFAAGAGARIVWGTGGVFLGRRVKGSTFLVPLVVSQYDIVGSIAGAAITTINNACAAFVAATSPDFKIWSRPHPGGQFATNQVTSGTCPDKVSTLRSRRV